MSRGDPGATASNWPSLLPGTELIGQSAGSGLREAPYLIRRRDGQVVQVSALIYRIAACLDGRPLSEVAHDASSQAGVRITPELIVYAADGSSSRSDCLPTAMELLPGSHAATSCSRSGSASASCPNEP